MDNVENGPLLGLRVLDLGTMIAGPVVGTFLADFGADVIKVEHPSGDPLRTWEPMIGGISLWWKVSARNKKLITLNLKHPRGQELCKALVKRTDILIENFRPGTLERWGLGYEDLCKLNRGLIMVRVSGYGQTGPYSDRPGYGTVAESMAGIPHFTGFPDGPPTLSAYPLADMNAALFGVMGALFALYDREKASGRGQVVDVSLYESLFRLPESFVIAYDQLGIIKERVGNRMMEDSPRNAYATKDHQWIAISASSQATFERLMRAIDRADLIADAKFTTNSARVANADLLDTIVREWFASRTASQAMLHLTRSDVVAGPIYDIRQIFEDPHYAARQDIVSIFDSEIDRTLRMQAVFPRLNRTPGRVRHPGLRKGFHNREVYCQELGLTPSDLTELSQAGIV